MIWHIGSSCARKRNEIICTCHHHHARNGRLNITAIVIYLFIVGRPLLSSPMFSVFAPKYLFFRKKQKTLNAPQWTRNSIILYLFFFFRLKHIELVTKNHYIQFALAHTFNDEMSIIWNWRKQKWIRPQEQKKKLRGQEKSTHWNWVSPLLPSSQRQLSDGSFGK